MLCITGRYHVPDKLPIPALPTGGAGELTALPGWDELSRNARSPETARAYRQDWQGFTAWCAARGLPVLPADPHTVAAYLSTMTVKGPGGAQRLAPVATVKRRAATIGAAHRAANLPDPTKHAGVTETLRSIVRTRGTNQKQAEALTQRQADRIVDRAESGELRIKGARDLALLLVGRDLLARASELVSLTVEAITWREDGTALVNLRRHKTETEARAYLLGTEAVEALRRWLEAAGITTGVLFRAVNRGGRVKASAITTRDVGRIVKDLAGDRHSAHSLRRGRAHDLVAAGLETGSIMQAGGWKSPAMIARYTQDLAAERGAVAQYHARRHK
jgi:integrase